MNVRNDISEELRSLSAVVAAISRQTPYEVPEGYFLALPAQVLLKVRGREEYKPLTFSVPEGYFEGFAQQVLDRIKSVAAAVEPLAGGVEGAEVNAGVANAGLTATGQAVEAGEDPYSSILAEIGRRTPYSVPEGYFEAHAPLLSVVRGVARGNNPYTVPADYFEGQAPLLAIARNNPYTVPAGYFDERATARRIAAVVEQEGVVAGSARVIALDVRRDVRRDVQKGGRKMNWLKYSAAAVVAGLILTVGFLRINKTGHGPNNQSAPIDIAKTMSTVSDQELQNFLTVQGATFEQPTNSASTLGASTLGAATLDVNDNDLKTLLGNVPDGELKQYMEEHGGTNDIATN
jgi:hypothetical protein